MTTALYEGNTEIHSELAALRDQVKSTRILQGFLVFLSVVVGVVLGFSLAAGLNLAVLLRAAPVRWAVLAALLSASGGAFVLYVLRPLLWNPTLDELARLAETTLPGLDNACINAVQLSRAPHGASAAMVGRAIAECVRRAKRFDLLAAVDRRGLVRVAVLAGVLGCIVLTYAVLAPKNLAAGVLMLLNPSRFVPAVGDSRISYVRPGDVEVLRGQDVKIEVGTVEPVDLPSRAYVYVAPAGGGQTRRELVPLSPSAFAVALGAADAPYEYLVEVAGTQSRWYRVAVSEKPCIKDMAVLYQYPQYTGLGHRAIEHFDGAISAPFGTKATLRVEATRPLASAYLDLSGTKVDLLSSSDEYHREASVSIRADGMYRVFLTDTAGNANDSSPPYAIKMIQDRPPAVSIPVPGRDVIGVAGSSVAIAVEATDDYGVAAVDLLLCDPDGQTETPLQRWEGALSKSTTLAHRVFVNPELFRPGRTYALFARARDGNSLTGPGVAESARYNLKVIDKEAADARLLAALEDIARRLREILAAQEASRALVEKVRAGRATASRELPNVKAAQASIRDKTAQVAAGILDENAALKEARRILETLIAGDMTEAIDVSGAAAAKTAGGAAADLGPLAAVQDRILDSLRRLIGALGILIDDVKDGRVSPASQIPAGVQEQLRKLLEALNNLIDDQKRIVEASSNLAAKPVNDYTDADKARIKELAAAEEDWSKFLKEASSDLSKLPKQDFADPTMLRDIVETYSEIEMAADALSKSTVTMAVPHEQVGLELAEELTTHIEKWLPDAPDRLKWDMEEPPGQTDVPMAELPANLQDIVGDLMEQEEALFSDIEDVSSSWADSIDTAAGWDAMDGPISNMSAQGVTGNVLPNSSEIAGRSGEGRTGKASGEFVGDTAVGKGGRRTPTRITPDDFVAGQVKDQSPQAAGATGGGKQAGAGQKGLQGPVPRQLSEAISGLVGRQAEIISGAEKVNISVHLAGYPNADMQTAIAAMKTTEESLRALRLGNAIRQRPVLVSSLKNLTAVIGRNLVIRKDNTLILPRGLEEAIIDGAQGRPPKGYDILLRGYYESLSVSR